MAPLLSATIASCKMFLYSHEKSMILTAVISIFYTGGRHEEETILDLTGTRRATR
jgi:hypothetical protein